jgi:hypothetical protein
MAKACVCGVLCATAGAGEVRPVSKEEVAQAIDRGVELLLGMQEGDAEAEWPYEGVYRVKGQIPIGYRVGGTAIACLALSQAPGYDADEKRRAAVARGLKFVCDSIEHPLMSEKDYDAGYDVRGWGYIYGVELIARLKSAKRVPAELVDAAERAMAFYLDAMQKTEIPKAGGWNYARPAGREKVARPSPFMTAPAVQAMLEAKRAGYAVDEGVIGRALDALERGRGEAGGVQYAGSVEDAKGRADGVPGAVGRMCAVEATLVMAGRGSVAQVRGAVDAFIVHWEWLNKRRAKSGTHEGRYGVAPYYFMYAHHAAARAIELLPEKERAEYRRRVTELMFSVRDEDGSWNDRVFKRTANFGTSFAMLAMMMPGGEVGVEKK